MFLNLLGSKINKWKADNKEMNTCTNRIKNVDEVQLFCVDT